MEYIERVLGKEGEFHAATALWPAGSHHVAYLQKIYLLATVLCMVGCIVAALSKTIGVLIGMRCFQAVGYVAPLLSLRLLTHALVYLPGPAPSSPSAPPPLQTSTNPRSAGQ